MVQPREQEPEKKFEKAPPGTYSFLEGYKGVQMGSSEPLDLLVILQERVCDKTGGSCMTFDLQRAEGKDFVSIVGHITDGDEIVFLVKTIARNGVAKLLKTGNVSGTVAKTDIASAMSEVRKFLPQPKQK